MAYPTAKEDAVDLALDNRDLAGLRLAQLDFKDIQSQRGVYEIQATGRCVPLLVKAQKIHFQEFLDYCFEEIITKEFKAHFSLTNVDAHGRTLLHWAMVCRQRVTVMNQCIASMKVNNISIDAGDSTGKTPLHEAVSAHHILGIETLIQHDADIYAHDDSPYVKRTPIHFAIIGPPFSFGPVFHADEDALRALLTTPKASGESKNSRTAALSFALHAAIELNIASVIPFLVNDLGADPNLSIDSVNRRSPLEIAVMPCQKPIDNAAADKAAKYAVIEALLKNQANPNQTDMYGFKPLDQAFERRLFDVAELLFRYGADPTVGRYLYSHIGIVCLAEDESTIQKELRYAHMSQLRVHVQNSNHRARFIEALEKVLKNDPEAEWCRSGGSLKHLKMFNVIQNLKTDLKHSSMKVPEQPKKFLFFYPENPIWTLRCLLDQCQVDGSYSDRRAMQLFFNKIKMKIKDIVGDKENALSADQREALGQILIYMGAIDGAPCGVQTLSTQMTKPSSGR